MNYNVGLDIGVASVGSAVVTEDYEIVESTSNIFPEADAAENLTRRSMRQNRRLTRRRKTRITDFVKLWKRMGFDVPESFDCNVLELRVRGLTEELSMDELFLVLQNDLKHRGISYLEDATDVSDSSQYAKGLKKNHEEMEDKYPCEIQLERLSKYGFYRGQHTIKESNEEVVLSNVFTVSAYREEIEQLFKTQRKYNEKITETFEEKYLDIFRRKREYYVGPGNEYSRTDYGKYTTRVNPVTGEYITEENIFEKLVGKCSVYTEERRASAASYTAQEFNVLNDLNNLVVNGRKLEKDEKIEIIRLMKTEKTVSVPRFLKKVMGETVESIEGARIDKNDKQIFHSFEIYNKQRKAFDELGMNIDDIFSVDELDLIGDILTLNTDKDSILSALNRNGFLLDEQISDCLISIRKKNTNLFNKWQSFSIKIMRELIPAMYEESKNQMQLLSDIGVFKSNTDKYKGLKYIPDKELLEEIYNPIVRRSVHTSIKVLNAYIKKYGYPQKIVIEMPRDKNSDEEKKFIKKIQDENEKELDNIKKKCKSEYGFEIKDEHFRNHKKLALKLKLWNEQKGKCLYSGRDIDIKELVENSSSFEVDHIIPLSISLDDSRNNKVLVYAIENQRKGNNTPYKYLKGIDRDWDYEKYREYVLSLGLTNSKRKKIQNLLFEQDITKLEVVRGFINRNLNDTAYASKLVLNTLQSFFKANDTNTKVYVIRGAFTHQMRMNLKLDKDREINSHHAVDAMLIAFSKMGYDAYHKLQENVIDFETGEILDGHDENDIVDDATYKKMLYEDKWFEIRTRISKAEKEVKYNYYVDKKINRGLCNQTIRGSREYDGKIYKINKLNIYTQDGIKTFKKKIEGGKEDQFLMKKNDPKTFEDLMSIYNQYKDAANPFVEYEKETGEYPRKYSKKHNGPRITNMKYTDGEVGSCIDISHKYGYEKGAKKVFLESLVPYRMDVYFNKNDNLYYFVGLKHSDFKYIKGKYMLDDDAYNRVLQEEKLIDSTQTHKDLEARGFEYRLSFYKNDLISYEKNGEIYERRFISRTMPQKRNYIEIKSVDGKELDKRTDGLSKAMNVTKIQTDILGNKFYVKREKFLK